MSTLDHEDLTAGGITTGYVRDAEHKLALVQREIQELTARLADLRDSEKFLTGFLAGLRGPVPGPRAESAPPEENVEEARAVADLEGQAVKPVGAVRNAAKRGRKTPASKRSSSAGPTQVDKVLQFLTENQGRHTVSEIAAGITGAAPGQGVVARVRTAAEGLVVARGRVQRNRQGRTVYYEVAAASGEPSMLTEAAEA